MDFYAECCNDFHTSDAAARPPINSELDNSNADPELSDSDSESEFSDSEYISSDCETASMPDIGMWSFISSINLCQRVIYWLGRRLEGCATPAGKP